jgi:hypothetical protein
MLIAGCGAVATEVPVADAAADSQPTVDSASIETSVVDADDVVDLGPVSVCTRCPAALPTGGAPCPYSLATDLVCSYGSNPVPWCRPRAWCGFDGWRVGSGGDCLAKNCPSAPSPSATCEEFSRSCFYPDGTLCTCARGRMECSAPGAGCSAILPNAGDRCSGEVRSCGYAAVTTGPDAVIGVSAECSDGCWKLGFFSGK